MEICPDSWGSLLGLKTLEVQILGCSLSVDESVLQTADQESPKEASL